MNKRIDFSNLGGFPLDQDALNWMQDSYRNGFANMAKAFGDKVILWGCVIAGGNVSAGAVVINGEPLPFIGGAYAPGDEVILVDDDSSALNPATFEDNSEKTVYFEKSARIGSGAGSFPFTDLKRIQLGPKLGIVEMFAGPVANIPADYNLCDGTILQIADYPELFAILSNVHGGNGVTTFALPNLKGRFIAGYDAVDGDYNAVGDNGGAKTHNLTQAQLPNVKIGIEIDTNDTSTTDGGGGSGVQRFAMGRDNFETGPYAPLQTAALGSGEAFDKRPPYYTLAFIIKLR